MVRHNETTSDDLIPGRWHPGWGTDPVTGIPYVFPPQPLSPFRDWLESCAAIGFLLAAVVGYLFIYGLWLLAILAWGVLMAIILL